MQMEYEILEKNDEFEDDACVKNSSHFVQSKEFFELLNILLDSAASKDPSIDDDEKILSKHNVGDMHLLKSISLVNYIFSF